MFSVNIDVVVTPKNGLLPWQNCNSQIKIWCEISCRGINISKTSSGYDIQLDIEYPPGNIYYKVTIEY